MKRRLAGVDILRGIVMLLMVIDHVRYFLSDAHFDPTDLARTTVPLFVTRWVTHFCAPLFMLLSGVGASLSLQGGRSRAEVSRFLFTRGAWLILLELTVARFSWQFNLDYGYTGLLVFWALGWSMIALAGLIRLPRTTVLAIVLLTILGHNALDGVAPGSWGSLDWLWTILHVPGGVSPGGGLFFFALYSLVPWFAVMGAGYLLGPLVAAPDGGPALRRLGLGMIALFIVLRAINLYGEPWHWTPQASPVMTVLSFLNTTKYPPSLLFLLMTIGPALALLPSLDRWKGRMADFIRTFGEVPLFFWLLHVPLIHLVALGLSRLQSGAVDPWLYSNPPVRPLEGYGFGLGVVYLVIVGVIAALYPACRWYAGYKARSTAAWVRYL